MAPDITLIHDFIRFISALLFVAVVILSYYGMQKYKYPLMAIITLAMILLGVSAIFGVLHFWGGNSICKLLEYFCFALAGAVCMIFFIKSKEEIVLGERIDD